MCCDHLRMIYDDIRLQINDSWSHQHHALQCPCTYTPLKLPHPLNITVAPHQAMNHYAVDPDKPLLWDDSQYIFCKYQGATIVSSQFGLLRQLMPCDFNLFIIIPHSECRLPVQLKGLFHRKIAAT